MHSFSLSGRLRSNLNYHEESVIKYSLRGRSGVELCATKYNCVRVKDYAHLRVHGVDAEFPSRRHCGKTITYNDSRLIGRHM